MTKIKISIYDDHASVRESYKRWLSASGFEIVSDSGELDKITDDIKKHKPDIILMDIDFPNKPEGGINTCKTLSQSSPNVKVVFVTHYDDPKIITSAFSARRSLRETQVQRVTSLNPTNLNSSKK